jgi:hypothetical protein
MKWIFIFLMHRLHVNLRGAYVGSVAAIAGLLRFEKASL